MRDCKGIFFFFDEDCKAKYKKLHIHAWKVSWACIRQGSIGQGQDGAILY